MRSPAVAAVLVLAGGLQAQVEQTYVKSFNPGPGDSFGYSSDADGDTLVFGAPGESSNTDGVDPPINEKAFSAGAVYVFVRSGTSWVQQAFLKASNSNALDDFGWSVALCGDTLVVGADREDSSAAGVDGPQLDNTLSDSGAAYVFVRNGTTWSQQAYLKATNPGAGDHFGEAVAVSGDSVVVGADDEDLGAGAAYVFVRNGTTWSPQATLKASNPDVLDRFGGRVAISGDTIVVGADLEDSAATGVNGDPTDNSANISGAAYVFVRTGTTWTQQAYLKSSHTGESDKFGSAVAIDGDRILVGAQGESSSTTGVDPPHDDQAFASGAAYVFERTGSDWTQTAFLKASNTGSTDFFGRAVALAGDRLLIGADGEGSPSTGVDGDQSSNTAFAAGAAYYFERSGPTWRQVAYMKSTNSELQDVFGFSVGLAEKWLVVGAPWEDSAAEGVGGDAGDNSAVFAGCANVFGFDYPVFYCTPKANSAGCLAYVTTSSATAHPVSAAADYSVLTSEVLGQTVGLIIAGTSGPASLPFSGGTLCLQPPIKRGPALLSGGSFSNCDGSFNMLVNDGTSFPVGLDAGPGNSAWYQYWHRDPNNGPGNLGTAMSNAVQLDFQ